jgi:hypothetical protein
MKLPAIIIGLSVVLATVARAQGELNELREAVHTPDAPTASADPPRSGDRDSYDDPFGDDPFEDDPVEDAIAWVAMATVAAPYWVPYHLIDEPGYDRFAGYGDKYEASGFKDTEWFCRSNDFVCSARALVEYGSNYDDLQTVGTRLQLDFPVWRASIDTSWNTYYEELASGTDELALGDANLVFRFAQASHTVWRSGIGINWLADNHTDVGFNFTYGFDVLPVHPFVWSTEFDVGKLGHAMLFRGRITVGAQWLEGELYTGFEYVDVDDANLPSMLFGFRYWW